ncbi:hypothetical protein PanWU01x14_016440, partial [Parasponia andersonii]
MGDPSMSYVIDAICRIGVEYQGLKEQMREVQRIHQMLVVKAVLKSVPLNLWISTMMKLEFMRVYLYHISVITRYRIPKFTLFRRMPLCWSLLHIRRGHGKE